MSLNMLVLCCLSNRNSPWSLSLICQCCMLNLWEKLCCPVLTVSPRPNNHYRAWKTRSINAILTVPKSGHNSLYPMTTMFPIIVFFSINLRKNTFCCCKNGVLFSKKRTFSKGFNSERTVRISRLEAELQLSVNNNVSTLKQMFLWDLRWIY